MVKDAISFHKVNATTRSKVTAGLFPENMK